MFRKTLLLLALGLLLAPVVQAQTVDEILAKHYDAMGGLEKLKALNTMRITGSMSMGQGTEAPIVVERKRPGKRRVEFTVQGMTGIQAFDGEKAWSFMPFMGKKDPEVSSDEDNKNELDDADFDGGLVDWKAKGHTVELVGKESVDGADAYKLKLTKKSGKVEYHYLDAETYLLVKEEGTVKRRGTEMEGEYTFSDYKDVQGYMLPFATEQGVKGMPQRQKMTISKIELNVPIDDSRFALPSATAAATTSDSTKSAPKADATAAGDEKAGDKAVTDAKADAGKKADAAKKPDAKAAAKSKKKKDQ
ncbi:MAG TPA: outer membrane lipoprotein-sorting protein [Candidatus Eisenbacteria bacterium]|jgi:outer membrane lipoprotein-sorting protein